MKSLEERLRELAVHWRQTGEQVAVGGALISAAGAIETLLANHENDIAAAKAELPPRLRETLDDLDKSLDMLGQAIADGDRRAIYAQARNVEVDAFQIKIMHKIGENA